MALSRLQDFEASSRRSLKEHELMQLDVYTTQQEKVGQVIDVLVDEAGHSQYLVVNLNTVDKQVLLPYNESQIDETTQSIYINRLTEAQLAELMVDNPTNNVVASVLDEEVTTCYYPL
ncbi:PRC-barrel domain-containing protein [Iningainema tapete]|uniref:PRC-barrel domain-containing protein n=1 Tax=Iningainema tapete BLCC-T55 TaxID=2748662 RepID=A0A8J6XGT3_9CYAN|nr:PRC-barrel domain-containing protein [Iningainema tapete]MBD2771791.1 PRC-barrel domain-containing protein [Iningainema tapete BLCC-T55]